MPKKRRKERRAKENAQRLAESRAKKKRQWREYGRQLRPTKNLNRKNVKISWHKQELEAIRQKERLAKNEKMNQEKKKRLLEKNRKLQHALEEARRIDRMNAKKINDERIAREEMVARNAANRYSADMVKKQKKNFEKR